MNQKTFSPEKPLLRGAFFIYIVMKKHYLILGGQANGKTYLSKIIANSIGNYVFIDGRHIGFSSFNKDTDCIIIDDVTKSNFYDSISFINSVKVDKKYENPFYINPSIIINCNFEVELTPSILSNFNVIDIK